MKNASRLPCPISHFAKGEIEAQPQVSLPGSQARKGVALNQMREEAEDQCLDMRAEPFSEK